MCPEYRGVLISGVNVYYKAQFGTFVNVLNTGCPQFWGFTVTTSVFLIRNMITVFIIIINTVIMFLIMNHYSNIELAS